MIFAYRLFSEEEARKIVEQVSTEQWEAVSTDRKRTLELRNTNPVAARALDRITKAIQASPIPDDHFIARFVPPKLNRYSGQGEYQSHADRAVMGDGVRTDLACTVFLTGDYEGGELVVGDRSVRGKPGTCVAYECWRPHHVAPVTRGERIVALTWLESSVPIAEHREILNLQRSIRAEGAELAKASAVYEKLFKLWSR